MHKFSVCEYLSRIEEAALEIEESKKPVDAVIVLWWGLDGLRLNEDGTTKWISRKKVEPVSSGVFHQPCQSIQQASALHPNLGQTQSTRAQIDALMAQNANLQTQAAQTVLNAAIISQLQPPMPGYLGYSPYMQSALASPIQQFCVQYPVQYPSYYYGGCCRLN